MLVKLDVVIHTIYVKVIYLTFCVATASLSYNLCLILVQLMPKITAVMKSECQK